MTDREARETVAKLVTLSRALLNLSSLLRLAAQLVPADELPAVTAEIEFHVRALLAAFDQHAQLALCDGDLRAALEGDLEAARKQLRTVSRIPSGEVELEIGDEYLPRQFREKGQTQ